MEKIFFIGCLRTLCGAVLVCRSAYPILPVRDMFPGAAYGSRSAEREWARPFPSKLWESIPAKRLFGKQRGAYTPEELRGRVKKLFRRPRKTMVGMVLNKD